MRSLSLSGLATVAAVTESLNSDDGPHSCPRLDAARVDIAPEDAT